MKDIYSQYGHVYRVGGDEFIAIIDIDGFKVKTLNKELFERIDDWVGKYSNHFSIALGAASSCELKEDAKVEDLIKLMDDRMYENKFIYHSQR